MRYPPPSPVWRASVAVVPVTNILQLLDAPSIYLAGDCAGRIVLINLVFPLSVASGYGAVGSITHVAFVCIRMHGGSAL
jgi:hypothetical protein